MGELTGGSQADSVAKGAALTEPEMGMACYMPDAG